jgi:hypothetical protein
LAEIEHHARDFHGVEKGLKKKADRKARQMEYALPLALFRLACFFSTVDPLGQRLSGESRLMQVSILTLDPFINPLKSRSLEIGTS